jgi:hypothetical protein
MNFSKRLGLKASTKELQLSSIDDDLRNSIWNCYKENIIDSIRSVYVGYREYGPLDEYFDYIWSRLLKKTHDNRPNNNEAYGYLKIQYFKFQWNEVYDFLEFHTTEEFFRKFNTIWNHIHQFESECNLIFKREFSGYRFIEHVIIPISNEVELSEINEALNHTSGFINNKYKNVQLHLKHAIEKLSDKKSPDYRNSIKESISAVESVCRELTGEETLGKALKKFEDKGIIFNSQFKQGIEKLYFYTNDKSTGIRHALLENTNTPSFEEAKFMLVTCSAFINYIIACNK